MDKTVHPQCRVYCLWSQTEDIGVVNILFQAHVPDLYLLS